MDGGSAPDKALGLDRIGVIEDLLTLLMNGWLVPIMDGGRRE